MAKISIISAIIFFLLMNCDATHSSPSKMSGIELADMDRTLLPPYTVDGPYEWTLLDPLRLKKRWSTQLRFGKRGIVKPPAWSSQVRFG